MAAAKGTTEAELPWVASPRSQCPLSPGVPGIHLCQDEEMTCLAKRSTWKFVLKCFWECLQPVSIRGGFSWKCLERLVGILCLHRPQHHFTSTDVANAAMGQCSGRAQAGIAATKVHTPCPVWAGADPTGALSCCHGSGTVLEVSWLMLV